MGAKAVVVGGLVLVAGAYVGWPYYTVYRLNQALEAEDEATLNALVDWPAVRAGFQADLRARGFGGAAPAEAGDEAAEGGGIAGLLAPAVENVMVDAYASPRGLARLIREGKIDENAGAAVVTEAQRRAREALAAVSAAAEEDEGGGDLPPLVGDLVTAAKGRLDEAQAYAEETVETLRRDYDYLFFTAPTSFRAEYAPATPAQTRPMALTLRLDVATLGWRLVRVELPG